MNIYSVLDRLLLWQKFIILSVIALILTGIPTYLYLQEANKSVTAAELERDGLPPTALILKVVQFTQQHRGLSALVLGGVDAAKDKRAAKQSEADQAYEAMTATIKNLHNKAIDDAWVQPRHDWETLRAGVSGGTITVPQSYAAHTALVPKLLVVNDLVADYYGLSLDPDVDSYQLIQSMYYQLPYLSEELGKMRAKGAGLLAKKEATPEDKMTLAGIIARVNDRLLQVVTSFNKAAATNPAIRAKLTSSVQEVATLAATTMQLATDKIVKADTLDYSSVDYVTATTQAIDAQFKANELASKELAGILAEKISDLHQTRWIMLTVMFGLIAMAGLIQYFIAKSVSMPLTHAVEVAERVATGDLTSNINFSGRSETAQLLRALKAMNDSLIQIVGDVRVSITNIGAATNDIAGGNADLSSRTESQASSLEETASSMEEMTSTVKQNADNARQANQLVVSASDVAVKGGQVVSQVVETMGEINNSSRKIVDIISVIDGIAFQTNILALNAAVEAARAGEQGRGFAVVASEVRNLAQRSAAAAKEIKSLIGDSVEKVDVGNKLVDQAGQSMQEIVASVKRVTDIMSEIVMASQEQTSGIDQINLAITQMDETTQQNSALVEQAAAATESLNEQALVLVQSMSVFNLGDEGQPVPAARPQAPASRATASRTQAPATRVTASRPTGRSDALAVRPAPQPVRQVATTATAGSDDWEEF